MVNSDAESVAGIPPGALLPGKDARVQGPAYDEWLAGEDAAALPI
jgi:hypothetical protein